MRRQTCWPTATRRIQYPASGTTGTASLARLMYVPATLAMSSALPWRSQRPSRWLPASAQRAWMPAMSKRDPTEKRTSTSTSWATTPRRIGNWSLAWFCTRPWLQEMDRPGPPPLQTCPSLATPQPDWSGRTKVSIARQPAGSTCSTGDGVDPDGRVSAHNAAPAPTPAPRAMAARPMRGLVDGRRATVRPPPRCRRNSPVRRTSGSPSSAPGGRCRRGWDRAETWRRQ